MSIPVDGYERTKRFVTHTWSGSTWDDGTAVGQAEQLGIIYQSGLPVMLAGDSAPTSPSPLSGRQIVVKRAFDIFVSLLAIIALAPLLLITAVAVRLDSAGPAFFRQRREGLNGRIFYALKFRSMRAEVEDRSGIAYTVPGDKRVTRLGAFLRKTSIDELPQLFNVLCGDMSIVGPRPHVPNMMAGPCSYRELVPYYDSRLVVTPGITGWAQANGLRGDATDPVVAKARIDHDLAYIQNYSLWLDLKIIFMTASREFIRGTGN